MELDVRITLLFYARGAALSRMLIFHIGYNSFRSGGREVADRNFRNRRHMKFWGGEQNYITI